MIIVLGATGTIGSHLVRLLSQRGTAVTAISRHPAKGVNLPGVTWVEADLSDRTALPDVLAGGERLFLLTGNTEDMVRLQKNALRAARHARIRHVVKLSALGASDHSKSVVGLWHYNVERELRDSGLAWTILRPHHFMQNLLDQKAAIAREGVVRSPSGEGKIPFVDTRDVAEVAAEVLTSMGHEEATYTLTGPEARSYREATNILAEVFGRPLTYLPETDDEAWARLRAAGQPPWLAAGLLAIAGYQRAGGPTEALTDTVERITGRPPRTLRQFALDYEAEFHKGRD